MSWQSILILAGFIAMVPVLILTSWVMDRFDAMDKDRP